MNIEAFLLCDCATDSGGKLNVLGAFDSIYVRQLPAVHPACTIAARIRFSKIEQGQHSIRINVIDQDGKDIAPRLEDKISVNIPDNVDSSVVNLILNLQRLKLDSCGEYRIDLAIDNRLEGSLPFSVRKVPYQH